MDIHPLKVSLLLCLVRILLFLNISNHTLLLLDIRLVCGTSRKQPPIGGIPLHLMILLPIYIKVFGVYFALIWYISEQENQCFVLEARAFCEYVELYSFMVASFSYHHDFIDVPLY